MAKIGFMEKTGKRIRRILAASGIAPWQRSHDRYILEEVIFPYFLGQGNFHRILFVGTDWYTYRYHQLFKKKHYATMDVDPAARKYGSPQCHVVDSMSNLVAHFSDGELDLVICNGVFGWGLDNKAEVESAFHASHVCLRNGGILVLGWNDIPERLPFPIDEIDSLRLFKSLPFPPLGTARFLTDNLRHTFDFYIK
jgi:SAM-dependent methyltransferase